MDIGSFLHHPSAAPRAIVGLYNLQPYTCYFLFPGSGFDSATHAPRPWTSRPNNPPARFPFRESLRRSELTHVTHVATRFTLGPPRTSEGFLPLHHACIILGMKKFGASIMPPCSPTRRYCCRRCGPLHCPRRRPLHRPLPCEAHSRSVFAGLRRRDSHDSQ